MQTSQVLVGLGLAATLLAASWSLNSCNSVDLPADVAAASAQLPDKIDYNLHVKPILSDRCFVCHGPDQSKQKAGLRLDMAEAAYEKECENGMKAIVPGNAAKSDLVKRILSADVDYVMPEPQSHLALSAEEKAVLVKWVQQGAEYKPHWSFIAPEKHTLPEVKNTTWAKNEIDRFILKKLEDKNLKPQAETDKTTLLRRVSMDLTGLPPTPAEVAAFLADQSPNAYEKVVNRLLASPHFGEHQAVDWLDVARYADTHGYQDDGLRTMWPYRDWVIQAFNKNLSFDQFTRWQLAGDMLPSPTREQLLATAFNRNHQQSQEGGIVPEEYRAEYVADRANTFGKAFLGLTVECARCHDHKYDPISQKDYYSLFAFFNSNNENGQIPYNGEASPTITLTTPEAEQKLRFIRTKLSTENQKLSVNAYQNRFETWLKEAEKNPEKSVLPAQQDLLGHFTFDEPKGKQFTNLANLKQAIKPQAEGDDSLSNVSSVAGKIGRARHIHGDNAVNFGKDFAYFERNQAFSVSIWFNLKSPKTVGTLFHKSNGVFNGHRGWEINRLADGRFQFTMSNVWPENAIDVETIEKLPLNQWTHFAFTYDGLSHASGLKLYINGREAKVNVINDHLTQSILYGKNKSNWYVDNMMIGRLSDQRTKDFAVDELKIYTRPLTALEMLGLFSQRDEILAALKTPAAQRTAVQQQSLLLYYAINFDADFKNHLAEARKLCGEETDILNKEIDVMVMKERKTPRKSYILKRGAYDAPAEEVSPATPSQFFKMPDDLPRNRLGLAQWLLHKDNPLFARVMVNRMWQRYFGKGLVVSAEDFGNQGDLPTHLELLDWLAVDFRESGWNNKLLQKKIVMSATYRQSSATNENLRENDPDNKLYARGPNYRYSAEQVRDAALSASGLLSGNIGGPSVRPYQPAGLWEALATRNTVNYVQQHGDTLYRRSMYTIWKRSSPAPMMLNFDAAERHTCSVRRQKTSTPLQALVTLNDPQFVEAARVLAMRAMNEGERLKVKGERLKGGAELTADGRQATKNPTNPKPQITNYKSQIETIFTALISRAPRPRELELMVQLYEDERRDFQKNPKRVAELLGVGEYALDKTLPKTELAALTVVASTVMNFDEFVIKR